MAGWGVAREQNTRVTIQAGVDGWQGTTRTSGEGRGREERGLGSQPWPDPWGCQAFNLGPGAAEHTLRFLESLRSQEAPLSRAFLSVTLQDTECSSKLFNRGPSALDPPQRPSVVRKQPKVPLSTLGNRLVFPWDNSGQHKTSLSADPSLGLPLTN